MTDHLTKYDKKVLFKEFEEYLKKKEPELEIPLSIFSEILSPLETVVKYLVEKDFSYSEIGRLLLKDRQVIWTTYKRAQKKLPKFKKEFSKYYIPVSKLKSEKLSIFELIVVYLKDLGLKNSEIAVLLKRDSKTIWTVNSRALAKRGDSQ
jgi:DNA-directed RNA polymerase specialized sigma24 family protein